ncbi:exonuclease SbcC [Clostridium punense]|uniref:Nuclease SbcCD subunit C n=2 Tax=Clostridium TaxID=1485 RepID=A0ABS4K3E9_9CLOT|nr:SMC family ATPase [Clostridium punense]MBP2022313.1 exonuclease SbcC [Clostridium punense]
MKLKKLIINGFGPYAIKQELDFEENLKGKNMFVITGNTGAGKTTIFDAINFALYGEPSGSDRDGRSLRSDFADPESPTEVELWFSIRDKDYYIKRTPTYLKPKQRGEGFTESKATAELKLSKEKTITGAKEVTKEIENILGITTEQFKQLVMIPQGEFKKLLNAKSEEKEDIFRKIFGTEIFERVQKDIKEEANGLKRRVEQIQRDRLNRIKAFNCKDKDEELYRLINGENPNIELLIMRFYDFIEEDKNEEKALEENLGIIEKNITKITENIAVGEGINKKFQDLDSCKIELEKLNGQIDDFKERKLQLDRGRKAITAKVYEDKYEEKKIELKRLEITLKTLEENVKKYKETLEKVTAEFLKQQGREEEKNSLLKQLDEVQRLKVKVSEYENNKKKLEAIENKVKVVRNRISEIDLEINANDNGVKTINKMLEDIGKAKEEKATVDIKIMECTTKAEKLLRLQSGINQWTKEKVNHNKEAETFNKLEENFKVAKGNYEYLEDTLRKSQAGILAKKLKQGEPCPVCGSTSHPKVAELKESEVTEEGLKQSKENLEIIRAERDKKLNELTHINSTLSSLRENTINPLIKEILKEEPSEDILSLKDVVQFLLKENEGTLQEFKIRLKVLMGKINEETENQKKKNDLENKVLTLRKELEQRNTELVEGEGLLSGAREALDTILKEFKGQVKSLKELEENERGLNKNLQLLKMAYEVAEKNFNEVKSDLDKEEGKLNTTKDIIVKIDEEKNKAVEIFKEKVLALGFEGYKDYINSRLEERQLLDLEKEINEFNSKLQTGKAIYEKALKETEGLSKVDLTEVKESLKKENEIKVIIETQVKEVFSRIKNNEDVLNSCITYNKAIEKDEQEYKIVGKLANIINGDNPKKISFERYVLASYFEDIINAANLRFIKMTSSRFELLRKQDIGDKRKGQGLDLEVFDNYTGKARDIKTLSGGESFKASLSMALGLADVVQSYAGGIQLDTMFIDEGFGTLDPESLDNAVECLMELQNDGRLVGVISHVAELKERIGARLEVSATNRGSKAEFRV